MDEGVANQETARARLFHDVLFVTVNTVPELHEVVLSRAARDAVRSESVVTSADAEAMPAPDGPVSAILNISMPLLVMPAVEVVKQTVLAVVDCIAQPLGAATDAAILYTEEFTANCTAILVDDELDVFVTRNTIVSEVFPIVTTLRATFSNWTVVAAKAVFAEKKRNNAKLEVKRGRQSFLSAVLNPPPFPPLIKGGMGGFFRSPSLEGVIAGFLYAFAGRALSRFHMKNQSFSYPCLLLSASNRDLLISLNHC